MDKIMNDISIHANMKPRRGCRDIWNAYMCKGAHYSKNDIPICPTTAPSIPNDIILWDEAKHLYKRATARGDTDFLCDAFVCFYMDDYKFDGPRGIWHDSYSALKILRHFSGVITPDFSTYQDFPEPIKIYNTFRMRAFGYWLGKEGISVINNVRWGTPESWYYCWDGIPHHSIVSVGTVASGLKRLENRPVFVAGIREMANQLQPHTILVYGSANYSIFDELRAQGIYIKAFRSRMDAVFSGRCSHE